MRAMIKALDERLELSAEQLTAVKSIYAEMGQSIGGLRQGGVSGDEFREAITQLRTQAARRVKELLSPEQKKQYEAARKKKKKKNHDVRAPIPAQTILRACLFVDLFVRVMTR